MERYALPSTPNFTMDVTPEGLLYAFVFRYIKGLMYVTINNAYGERIAGPIRVCEGEWLIPYNAYNYDGAGNFRVIESKQQYPIFDIFNTSCELQYFTSDEIKIIETSNE